MSKIVIRPTLVQVTVNKGTFNLSLAQPPEFEADCAPEVPVGAAVYVQAEVAGRPVVAVSSADNGSTFPIAGIVTSKPTTTRALVKFGGAVSVSGLTPGLDAFVGLNGAIVSTPPEPAPGQVRFFHRVGVAKGASTLLLEIGNEIVEING